MKSFAQLAGFSFALIAAGLGSGCASSTPTATYRQPAQDFEVVESSTDRPLTETEKAEVRASVASYLDREGVSDSGDYFLKVYLTPENMDADSEWVVVRFTRYTEQRVAVVSAYPYDNYMYSSYYPYYAYDIYPYGYGCVARISFQYYVDPLYNHRHYYYPYHGHGGHKGDHHDTAHNHGGKPNSPGDHHGSGNDNNKPPSNRPSGPKYTGNRPPTVPLNVDTPASQPRDNPRNQWRGRPGTSGTPSSVANTRNRPEGANGANNLNPPVPEQNTAAVPAAADPRRENSRNQWRGRPGTGAPAPDIANNGNRPEAPSRVNNPNPNPRPQGYRPVGSTASAPSPANNPSTQRRNERTDPRPTPSRVNNPTRTEAYVSPTMNRPAPSQRPAPNYSRPAPNVQQTRAPAQSYQPQRQQPERSAPPSSSPSRSDRSESRQTENGQREVLR